MRLVLLGLALAGAGCADRRLQVTSDPPGAAVWINDVEVGRTPVEAGFVYYGTYDVRLQKEGYEPLSVGRTAHAPWHQYPPFDLVAEASPWPVRTHIAWYFDMVRPEADPAQFGEEAILRRARDLRGQVADPAKEPPTPAPEPPSP